MPTKSKKVVKRSVIKVEKPVEEVVIEETVPKMHVVQVKVNKYLPNIPVPVVFPVGEVRYWESTDDITYSFEVGHQIYMDNFVMRAIQIDKNQWVPRESTRKWVENLPDAILEDGFFTSDIITMDELGRIV